MKRNYHPEGNNEGRAAKQVVGEKKGKTMYVCMHVFNVCMYVCVLQEDNIFLIDSVSSNDEYRVNVYLFQST
jgi:hypothetical protein